MTTAVKVENLGKRFLLGESFEHTLSSRVGDLLRGRVRRAAGREEFWALRDVNFEVKEGEALGIIGGNGAGKSTLLKVLSRITPPTEGRARVKGRLSSLLEVGTGFHPELTGRENVFLNGAILGMRKAEVQRKFDEIVAFSGVEKFIDTPVKRYSSGMYVRLAFAVAAHLEPDVLIIDEVLAVGDADFQKRCLGKMNDVAKQGRTVLFVSHNMAAVRALCERAVWLRSGTVELMGAASGVIDRYLRNELTNSAGKVEHVGYAYLEEGSEQASASKTRVTSLQILSEQGDVLVAPKTNEKVRFRIKFACEENYRSLAVEFKIQTQEGVPLIWCATSPSEGMQFQAEKACYSIECIFDRFPLSAGSYQLGVALAIPRSEYIWSEEFLCELVVGESDIFGTGYPPKAEHYLVHSQHAWLGPLINEREITGE